MRISVRHFTHYRYASPVVLGPHLLRLRPRTSADQRLLSFDIDINPVPAGTAECLDQDGNLAINAWFRASTTTLDVNARFEVDLLRDNPFDYVLAGEPLGLPLSYGEPLGAALAPYRDARSISPAVSKYARSAAEDAGADALMFLVGINRRIYENTEHIVRPEGNAWPSNQTLGEHRGSCRDLAVLFCELCRSVGIAGRFVSGYEIASANRDDASMHAWAEAYLPGIGWRGYDPSRGLVVSNGHIAVAAAANWQLATPIAGSYTGGAESDIKGRITLTLSDAAELPRQRTPRHPSGCEQRLIVKWRL